MEGKIRMSTEAILLCRKFDNSYNAYAYLDHVINDLGYVGAVCLPTWDGFAVLV